ncbi:STAS domain-containing protein [Clostridium tagluense]|uniref:STAS domain-containing protein n=1 Tax=Clostridium TaxID=1485 RepID=UPI0013E9216D|nr:MULTISPECIES: STAS domain-containing protein [Clostridium]MBZ9621875.1 STAS domain-containing protein [Clostridium sp. FP2]MBZ9633421.1 STAS domain-containing protein [Clostridium sp. FP1]MCB2312600.1 STAS domain-containing protein [Clostridium tagluense]MCB2317276.1 STAS domain-containing protein [Clostridium tagluense]MCB2322143.1 STAS domain-containing protein [Clostridium tagluense]
MKNLDYDLNTSVTIVQGCIIITLPNEMTDEAIEIGMSRILNKANATSTVGAILDLSRVTVLDSYSFTALEKTAKAISLMGVIVVWIGFRPGVVSALLDLNVDVSSIKAALNLEQGLKMISDILCNKNRGTN